MKQLFVAIVVVLFSNFGAVAEERTTGVWSVENLSNANAIKQAWSYEGSENGDVPSSAYKKHVYDDSNKFEYVSISAAKNIYEHGAHFCRMFFQHNWGGWDAWMDTNNFCMTLCKDGYSGAQCNQLITGSSDLECYDGDLRDIFNTDNEDKNLTKEIIRVFSYDNAHSAIPLMVIKTKEHAIQVQPVKFYGTYNYTIDQVKSMSEKSEWLCAPGYVKNTDGDCVRSTYCKKLDDGDNPLQCPTTRKQGWNANRTSCLNCNELGRQWFYDAEKSECVNYKTSLSKMDMRIGPDNQECWQIKDKDLYYNCVFGKD